MSIQCTCGEATVKRYDGIYIKMGTTKEHCNLPAICQTAV